MQENEPKRPPNGGVRLAFVGDIGLSARVAEMLRREDPAFVPLLREADLAFANLEVPLLGPAGAHASLKIRGEVADAPLLRKIGISVVSLANNHILDAGPEGLASTRSALRDLEIETIGAGASLDEALRPVILERRGIRIGWLAWAEGAASTHRYIARKDRPGAAPLEETAIRRSVTELRPQVDLLCVSVHQGVNYVHYASPRQRRFAQVAAEAGADLVIGHHPHVLQGWERIGRTLVFHSLGEFLWDPHVGNVVESRWNEARRRTAVLTIDVAPGRASGFTFHPFRAADDFRLLALSGEERARFDAWMGEISAVYADYDPSVYLEAADQGLVEHWLKVVRFNLRQGNVRYFTGILSRVRGRHLQIGWTHLKRKLRGR